MPAYRLETETGVTDEGMLPTTEDEAGAERELDTQAEDAPVAEETVRDEPGVPGSEAGDSTGDEPEAGDGDPEDEAAPEGDLRTELDLPLENVIESLLIAATGPLTVKQLRRAAGKGTKTRQVEEALAALNESYEQTGRAFEIVNVNQAYQIMTLPEYAMFIRPAVKREEEGRKLSPASLDTLAIIAYRQPIMRVDVERIRGVGCGPVLRNLIEWGLVEVVGRNTEVIGHPMLYGTTDRFLEQFGLASLDALPESQDLRQPQSVLTALQEEDAEDPGSDAEDLPALSLAAPPDETEDSDEAAEPSVADGEDAEIDEDLPPAI